MTHLIAQHPLDTVKIIDPDHEQGFVIINASDFDAETMTRFDDAEALPSTRALQGVLADMTDVEAITAMAERDTRRSASSMYAARLAELKA